MPKDVEVGLHSAGQGGYKLHDLDLVPRRYDKERHIYISKDNLFYDIDAATLIVARARRDGNNTDKQDIPSDENGLRPIFERWIDKYTNLAINRMQAYVKPEPRTSMMNNLNQWEEKDIFLMMPDNWDESTFEPLKDAVHNYIVNGVLYEYFVLNLTEKDPVTLSKKQEMDVAYEDIKNCVCAYIPGTVHKAMHPFGIL